MSHPLKVLIVEDNPDDATLILRELKRAGYRVDSKRVETEDGFTNNLDPSLDLVLSDHSMPEFSSIRALELLRKAGFDIPFIIVSGSIGEDIAVNAMKNGASDYLIKDRLARLGHAVQHALAERRLRQERRQAFADLRNSEERFRQFAENINEVCWLASADHSQILYVSPAYEKIWGYTCQSLYHRPASLTEAIYEEDRAEAMQALRAVSLGKELDFEHRIRRPDSSIRWIHSRCTGIRDEKGVIYRLAGTAEDITDRKEMEQKFLHSQKMDSLGLMAGGVAHDFSNLLAVIGLNLELVLTANKNLDAKSKSYLGDIAYATDRALTLNRQLLAFSRREVAQMQVLDLSDLAGTFAKMLRRIVGEHIRLQTRFAPKLPNVKIDRGMIEQVLMNLAVNARDAMPKGGNLTISTQAVTVDQAAAIANPRARPGQFICLSVQDTGSGIAPENLQRIFEPYFTTKAPGKGIGLGLSTVFGIIEQHKGWIEVTSQLGVGTEFRVMLPSTTESATDIRYGAELKVQGGTESILLVEDERAIRSVMCQVLEKYGYRVIEAESGPTAVAAWNAQKGKFDLLITDIVMPGGQSGLELIDALRKNKPTLKVLLISGYAKDQAQRDLHPAPDITHLHKPFSTQTLANTVRQSLDTK